MKNILVVFTGGTIGSSIKDNVIDTAAENQFLLLQQYRQTYARAAEINFSTLAPVELLSENLVPAVWEQLLRGIDASLHDGLDGIIVTHGTDTLAFTASALALYYRDIKIPLLLVSSDYPLTDSRANGLCNFNAALEFIVQRAEAGVFVAYKNPEQVLHIHQGQRLASCLPLSGDFISVQNKPYLAYDDTGFTCLNPLERTAITVDHGRLQALCSEHILLLRPYPGLNYTHVNLTGVQAVLHDLYHSGTACVDNRYGEAHSLLNFMERCRDHGVTVYLAPALHKSNVYASTKLLQSHGGVFLWNTSIELAYAALVFAYGNYAEAALRSRFLQTCCDV